MSPKRIGSCIFIILLYLVLIYLFLYPLVIRILTNMVSESLMCEFSYGLIQGWFFGITVFVVIIAIAVWILP